MPPYVCPAFSQLRLLCLHVDFLRLFVRLLCASLAFGFSDFCPHSTRLSLIFGRVRCFLHSVHRLHAPKARETPKKFYAFQYTVVHEGEECSRPLRQLTCTVPNDVTRGRSGYDGTKVGEWTYNTTIARYGHQHGDGRHKQSSRE